jgi:hypothetical protein
MTKSDLLIIVLCASCGLIGSLIGGSIAYKSCYKELKANFEKNDLRRKKRKSLQP